MGTFFERARTIGWFTVEAALLLVLICLLFSVILGADSGWFVYSVAENAVSLLERVPPGSLLAIVIIILLYRFARMRF